jgi:predicted NAD/FAD-binding protein
VDKVGRAVDDIRRKWVPDGRLGVFDVSIDASAGAQHAAPLLNGATTSRDARDALRRLAGESGLIEKVVLLPNEVPAPAAIVTAALAPLQGEPKVSTPRDIWQPVPVAGRRTGNNAPRRAHSAPIS